MRKCPLRTRGRFQSTSSARRTTSRMRCSGLCRLRFQSTSSARRTTVIIPVGVFHIIISIHVLREEDDVISCRSPSGQSISIHVLREEDDCLLSAAGSRILYFNPRPPRGGRPLAVQPPPSAWAISIHVLREEDDRSTDAVYSRIYHISIHVLREEDDPFAMSMQYCTSDFNPRPPRGGRQDSRFFSDSVISISIHVLREEDDAR